jgi:hypothetical protein
VTKYIIIGGPQIVDMPPRTPPIEPTTGASQRSDDGATDHPPLEPIGDDEQDQHRADDAVKHVRLQADDQAGAEPHEQKQADDHRPEALQGFAEISGAHRLPQIGQDDRHGDQGQNGRYRKESGHDRDGNDRQADPDRPLDEPADDQRRDGGDDDRNIEAKHALIARARHHGRRPDQAPQTEVHIGKVAVAQIDTMAAGSIRYCPIDRVPYRRRPSAGPRMRCHYSFFAAASVVTIIGMLAIAGGKCPTW